jgi:hypothetical protein
MFEVANTSCRTRGFLTDLPVISADPATETALALVRRLLASAREPA